MNSTFNASRKASTELASITCFSGSRTGNLKNGLGKYPTPSVTNANELNPWIFVRSQEMASLVGRHPREGNHWLASKQSMPQ